MSELAIVFSDLHVHPYKGFNENERRLKNCIDFIDYIYKLADKNHIDYILMPGDLHNLMQIVSVKAVNAVITCMHRNFHTFPNIKIIAISGNHDMAVKNIIGTPIESVLQHLNEIFPQNFILLDNVYSFITTEGNIIQGIAYYEYPEHFIKKLKLVNEKLKEKEPETGDTLKEITGGKLILLTHQNIASGLPIEDTIEPDDPLFEPFDMVFNGHIHHGQEITDKFINVGSPMHRDAGDIGKKKGFWVVDLCDPVGTISFKDITDRYPQFIQIDEGKELTDWESQQYVIRVPMLSAETPEDIAVVENFKTNLQPAAIMQNYCESLKVDKDTLEYGLKLLV